MPGCPARVQLVTPAIVERTVARRGMSGVLTLAERATFDAFPTPRRRRDWLSGRIAAKRAVRAASRDLGASAPSYDAIETWNDHRGAPRFRVPGHAWLADANLSISHCDGAGLASVVHAHVSGTVGVDIEVTRPLSLALVSRVLRDAELARLDDAGDVVSPSPLELWTAKEAALKSADGACTALRDIELSWDMADEFRARVPASRGGQRDIIVRHRIVGPYTLAVALCR